MKGVGAGSAAAALLQPPAGLFTRSRCPQLAARRAALGCSQLWLLARRSGVAWAQEDRIACLAGQAPSGPRKQVGDWARTARTRSLGPPRVQGAGGRRGGFAASRLTFHRFHGFPAALLGSRLRKPSSARGGFGERRGVRTGRGRGRPLAPAGVGPLAAVGTQSSQLGKTRAQWRGAIVPGRAPARPSESGDSSPRAAPSTTAAHNATGTLPAGVQAQSLWDAARSLTQPAVRPAVPSPSLCLARFCFFGGATWNIFISFSPDSLRGSPSHPILGLTSQTSLLPSAATLAP